MALEGRIAEGIALLQIPGEGAKAAGAQFLLFTVQCWQLRTSELAASRTA
jgi:hypothetical protein